MYIVGHKYNSNVEPTQSFVHKKEKYIIDHFKIERQEKIYRGRGKERVFKDNIEKLIELINDTSNKSWDDVETIRRKSERLKQAELTKDDKIEKITGHHTKKEGKSKTTYRVVWDRPYVLTEKERTKSGVKTSSKEIFTINESKKKY